MWWNRASGDLAFDSTQIINSATPVNHNYGSVSVLPPLAFDNTDTGA